MEIESKPKTRFAPIQIHEGLKDVFGPTIILFGLPTKVVLGGGGGRVETWISIWCCCSVGKIWVRAMESVSRDITGAFLSSRRTQQLDIS